MVTAKLNEENLMSNVTLTVEVKTTKRYAVKKAVAFWLIALAARLLNCNIEIVDHD